MPDKQALKNLVFEARLNVASWIMGIAVTVAPEPFSDWMTYALGQAVRRHHRAKEDGHV